MRLLLDSCVWGGCKAELVEAGHDVEWAGDWESDPGDAEILARAHAEDRVLVTIDKDFGTLAIHGGFPHRGIIRIVNFSARKHGAVCLHVINTHADELSRSAIITAEPGRLRIRLPS